MKIYRHRNNPLDVVGVDQHGLLWPDRRLVASVEHTAPPDIGLAAAGYALDNDYTDACRFRLLMYAATNPESAEAKMMDELTEGALAGELSPPQMAARAAHCIDQVRAKYGEKVWP